MLQVQSIAVNAVMPPVEILLDTANHSAISADYEWLKEVFKCNESNDLNVDSQNMTWASHHANISHTEPKPSPIIAMMPLFRYSANTVAMIRHSMSVVQAAVQTLNPNQVLVVTLTSPCMHWRSRFNGIGQKNSERINSLS